jgi:glucose/arabinose dehydrogenase
MNGALSNMYTYTVQLEPGEGKPVVDDNLRDRLVRRIVLSTMTLNRSGLAAAFSLSLAVVPVPQDLASHVKLSVVAEKLDQPLGMAFAPNDPTKRLFIVEKTGAIRVLKAGRVLPEPFLDLRSRVSRGSEQGLLGLAFHGKFATSGRLFVNYTDKDGDTRIVEITVASPAADHATIASERQLLFVDQPYANHNGGNLVMTPEGWLLVGLGDGGSAGDPRGNAQNPKSLLGKMIRLDPDAESDALRVRILAQGMRNPWRYAIDRAKGDLYIGDVGQYLWEEVDVVPMASLSGKNFGWNVMEASHCFRSTSCNQDGLTPPVVEYGHDLGCSITGGVVYRGKALPALAGAYFYADYCTALLRSFRFSKDGGVTDHWDWKKTLDPTGRLAQIASFGEDEDGEVYIIGLDGTVWKLVPAN